MIIIYGYGNYAKDLIGKYENPYSIPYKEIEVIVDKTPGSWKGIKTIEWEDYLLHKEQYHADKVVIGSIKYYEEIKNIILKSKAFDESQIISIDKWVDSFAKKDNNRDKVQLLQYPFRKEQLWNAHVLPYREAALCEMPKGMVVAEVGVAYGDLSEKILKVMEPEKFYAIDVFLESTKGFWGKKTFYENNTTHLSFYEEKFKDYIEKGILETRKGYSWEELEKFPDHYFDWVYLDAAHDYNSVKRDVSVLIRKVKQGGYIQFNDYIFYDYVGKKPYGVAHVINELLHNTKSEMLFYCLSSSGFDDVVIKICI